MKANNGNNNDLNNDSSKGVGVSGQQPGPMEGPVAGGADNTRGQNVSSREGSGGGAKKGKSRAGSDYPQASHANPSDTTRGADSADKEFRNDQFNASTLKGMKSNENLGEEKE